MFCALIPEIGVTGLLRCQYELSQGRTKALLWDQGLARSPGMDNIGAPGFDRDLRLFGHFEESFYPIRIT